MFVLNLNWFYKEFGDFNYLKLEFNMYNILFLKLKIDFYKILIYCHNQVHHEEWYEKANKPLENILKKSTINYNMLYVKSKHKTVPKYRNEDD